MNSCYCEDYETPEFFRQETRKAVKQHRCYECNGNILNGENYRASTGKWEGEVITYKTCQRCLDLLVFVQAHIPCVCWGFGSMREDVLNEVREWDDEAPGLFFGAYRREIKIRKASARIRTQQGNHQ